MTIDLNIFDALDPDLTSRGTKVAVSVFNFRSCAKLSQNVPLDKEIDSLSLKSTLTHKKVRNGISGNEKLTYLRTF